MKLRPLDEIIENGPTDTGDLSTKDALISAYCSVEENPNGDPQRRKVMAILRKLLLEMN